jgi:predicted nucleic acid-binding protein
MGLMSARIEVTVDRERALLRSGARLLRSALQRVRSWIRARSPAARGPRTAEYLAALSRAFGPVPPGTLDDGAAPFATLVLDAGAIAELARGNARARAVVAQGVGRFARIVVPATSLLDPSIATIAEFVARAVVVDAPIAQRAGALMARAGLPRPFDAFVVACAAAAAPAAILTTDPSSLGALARATDQDDVFVFGL